MENTPLPVQNQPVQQAPIAPPPVEQPVQPEQPQPAKPSIFSNKILVISLGVIILIALGIGGYFGYQNLSGKKMSVTQNESGEQSDLAMMAEELEATPTPDPMEGWETYENSNKEISFQYPSSWTIEEKSDEYMQSIFIKKGEYQIHYYVTSLGFEANVCIFPDDSRYSMTEEEIGPRFTSLKCDGQYITYQVNNKKIRRLINPYKDDNAATWNIYFPINSKEYHVSLPPISFTAPANYDNKTIEEMDKILSSFKFVEKN
jgi:hypothetical protein